MSCAKNDEDRVGNLSLELARLAGLMVSSPSAVLSDVLFSSISFLILGRKR